MTVNLAKQAIESFRHVLPADKCALIYEYAKPTDKEITNYALPILFVDYFKNEPFAKNLKEIVKLWCADVERLDLTGSLEIFEPFKRNNHTYEILLAKAIRNFFPSLKSIKLPLLDTSYTEHAITQELEAPYDSGPAYYFDKASFYSHLGREVKIKKIKKMNMYSTVANFLEQYSSHAMPLSLRIQIESQPGTLHVLFQASLKPLPPSTAVIEVLKD